MWSNILWLFFVIELHRENEVDTLLRALLFTLVPIAYDAQMSLALLALSNLLATISTTRFRLPHLRVVSFRQKTRLVFATGSKTARVGVHLRAVRHAWGEVGGWGGVGMMTFLALAHMVDATQVMGWGGVGMMTFLALAHMVGATQVMGWGGVGWA